MRTASAGHLVVTGAAGLVGRPLVTGALDGGWRVTALVRHPEEMQRRAGVQLVRWRVGEALPEVCRGAEALCHLAAMVPRDGGSPSNAEECFRVNALGTLQLLEQARALDVGRVVYTSAGNAYRPQSRPVTEGDPLFPSQRASIYLTSKLAGEIFCEHYRTERGLPVTVLRVSAVYGPGMPEGSVVVTFLRSAAAGHPLRVANGGRYAVDLVQASDVAHAIRAAVEREASGIFNVGSGRSTSLLELAHAAVDVAGAPRSLVEVEPADSEAAAPGYPTLDIRRAEEVLNFRPTPLESGLARMMADATFQGPAR